MTKYFLGLILSFACASSSLSYDHNDSDFPQSLSQPDEPPALGIVAAWYDDASDRYGHGVLGDAIEPTTLTVRTSSGRVISETLDAAHVFEDISTRLADIDRKPGLEVVTIRSHKNKGAQLAIYALTDDNQLQLLTSTPYIGTSNRWLAPIGIADFNKDGYTDIAYVDRPHLAKILRVWSYQDGELVQLANRSGYSNHRIGEDFISGGIKHCKDPVSMITANKYWDRILETQLIDGELVSRDIGAITHAESLTEALRCN